MKRLLVSLNYKATEYAWLYFLLLHNSLIIAIAVLMAAFAAGLNCMADYAIHVRDNLDQAGEHSGMIQKAVYRQLMELDKP